MSDYSDPFESPYLKRLRVWRERARETARLRAQAEVQWKMLEAISDAKGREWIHAEQVKAP